MAAGNRIGKLAIFLAAFAAIGAVETRAADRPPPWHLVDIWWDLGRDIALERFGLDVTIEGNVPADVNLYIAPIGLGKLSGTQFYGGLQTQIDGYTKEDRRLRKLGPGMLMSMWGERSFDAIRPAEGGFCQSSGHEGDFVSVRQPFAWKPGKYRYEIVRMDRELVGDGATTWVGAYLHVYATGENVFVGALRFPSEKLVLGRRTASFVEIYGRAIPVERIPRLTVTLGNFTAAGRPVATAGATAIYPDGVPDYARATAENGHVVIRVGEPIENRRERRVRLMPPPAG
jgi:hypothetical protein